MRIELHFLCVGSEKVKVGYAPPSNLFKRTRLNVVFWTLGSAHLKKGKKAAGEKLPTLIPVPDNAECGKNLANLSNRFAATACLIIPAFDTNATRMRIGPKSYGRAIQLFTLLTIQRQEPVAQACREFLKLHT